MTDTDLVKQVYENLASGNVPAALALFDIKIEWCECYGMPFIKGDGWFTGPDDVVKNVFMQLPVVYDNFHVEVSEIFGDGDKVARLVITREVIKLPAILSKPMLPISGQ